MDGYDEMRPEFLWQNLFRTNNLERLRSHFEASDITEAEDAAGSDKGSRKGSARKPTRGSTTASSKGGSSDIVIEDDLSMPKLMIFSRAELLDGKDEYENSFLPVEASNAKKEDLQGARKFYCEYRLAPFNDEQRSAYIRALVALRTRQAFEARFDTMMPLYRGRRSTLYRARQLLAGWSATDRGRGNRNTYRLLLVQLEAVVMHASVANHDGVQIDDSLWSERMPRLLKLVLDEFAHARSRSSGGDDNEGTHVSDEIGVTIAALAVLHSAAPSNKSFLRETNVDNQKDIARLAEADRLKLSELLTAASDDLWSFTKYDSSIKGLRELASLLKTPFMIQIVTQILPTLSNSASTPASVKSELILLINDGALWEFELRASRQRCGCWSSRC